ncbi:MAG: hypothetical protein KJ613_01320, partial [Nanoarchaeota archaeon]|nr:hypothetical protein [Nanoarchaeota archaeon]
IYKPPFQFFIMNKFIMALLIPVMLLIVAWLALGVGLLFVTGILISFAVLYGAGKYAEVNKFIPILSIIVLVLMWMLFASGIVTSTWSMFLGVVLFGWGFIFSFLMYDFMDKLNGKIIGVGVIMMILGAFLVIMPFAPQLFL